MFVRASARLAVGLVVGAAASAQLAPWPAGPGTEIGHEGAPGGLPAAFETSGVVWHPGRGTVVVVSDDGLVAELPAHGGAPSIWPLPGDLEAVALADPASSLVYIGIEQPDGVVEFDLATGQPTANHWDLTPWMTGPANEGLEALAYVDGVFYAGLQADGTIFRFVLGTGGGVQFLGSFPSHLGRTDLSGLDYDACAGVLYALHDTADVIVEYDASGTFLCEYSLAGSDQEGVALMGGSPTTSTPIFIAQDTGELFRYETYPVASCAPGSWTDVGGGTPGSQGVPALVGSGPLQAGWPVALDLVQAPPGALMLLWLSLASTPASYFGGTLHAFPATSEIVLLTNGGGEFHVGANWPAGLPAGTNLWLQFLVQDGTVSWGITLSNGLLATVP